MLTIPDIKEMLTIKYTDDIFHRLKYDKSILSFNPFVCTKQRHFLCYLRWREINLVVMKWLYNRTGFRRILCQLFQFMLLCMEFIGFAFEFFLIFGNEFLHIYFLNLIFVKSYLARRERFIDFSIVRFPDIAGDGCCPPPCPD